MATTICVEIIPDTLGRRGETIQLCRDISDVLTLGHAEPIDREKFAKRLSEVITEQILEYLSEEDTLMGYKIKEK
tara:strand:- start:1330 stop:1554 length:225 start_codon:yes stop_codon:yes gene_type:complete